MPEFGSALDVILLRMPSKHAHAAFISLFKPIYMIIIVNFAKKKEGDTGLQYLRQRVIKSFAKGANL